MGFNSGFKGLNKNPLDYINMNIIIFTHFSYIVNEIYNDEESSPVFHS